MVHGSIFGDARVATRGLVTLQLQRMPARYRLGYVAARLFAGQGKLAASSLWFIALMAVA